MIRLYEKIEVLKEWLLTDTNIVVFTGAGVSTASGILDFRGKNGLAWKKQEVPISVSLSKSYFVRQPESFYRLFRKNLVYKDKKPNLVHDWIASLEEDHHVTVVTQNIDSLHEMAGSTEVFKLHGSVSSFSCTRCKKGYDDSCLKQVIPVCVCGGIVRPDIVLYEEMLDEEVWSRSVFAIMRADLLLVLGSSLVVQPAAGLLSYYQKKHMVIINQDETCYDRRANLVIHEDLIRVIKALRK